MTVPAIEQPHRSPPGIGRSRVPSSIELRDRWATRRRERSDTRRMGDDREVRRANDEPSGSDTRDEVDEFGSEQPSLQQIAHDRGRICKKRGCVVCAPLRARRRDKKRERRAEARARRHERGEPCGKSDCDVPACVEARQSGKNSPPERDGIGSDGDARGSVGTTPSTTAADRRPRRDDASSSDAERVRRREAERHRVGLPCGSENCVEPACVEGLANERKRRHRAGRPCRSSTCDSAICVAARRSTT